MIQPQRLQLCCCIVAASLTLLGCASSKAKTNSAPAPTYRQTAAGPAVPVSITDKRIIMPTRIPPGQATFQITNNTKHQRDLKIIGDGVDASLFTPIEPGATGEMLVNLHPGQYTVTALDGQHMSAGVSAQLTVTQP